MIPPAVAGWQTARMSCERRDTSAGVAISLFSGAGGLDLGVEQAAYQVRAAVERYPDATLTMEKNFPHLSSAVIRSDILDVPTSDILRAAGLRGRARPDLLIGGSPCTPFSKSGFWLDWKRAGLDPERQPAPGIHPSAARSPAAPVHLENVYALTYNNQASRPVRAAAAGKSTTLATTTAKVLKPLTTACRRPGPGCSSGVRGKARRCLIIPAPSHAEYWERRTTGDPAAGRMSQRRGMAGWRASPNQSEDLRRPVRAPAPEIPPARTTCTTPQRGS